MIHLLNTELLSFNNESVLSSRREYRPLYVLVYFPHTTKLYKYLDLGSEVDCEIDAMYITVCDIGDTIRIRSVPLDECIIGRTVAYLRY